MNTQIDDQSETSHSQSRVDTMPENRTVRLTFASFTLPQPVAGAISDLQQFGQRQRDKTLEATPAVIVNNSSNIIGAMELGAECMVFKATGSNLVSRENRGKPIHYIIDPPLNILKSVRSRASFDMKPSDLLDPGFYKRSLSEFVDLDKASRKDLRRGRLINRWQARAMLSSLAGMTVTTIIPQKKEDPDDTVRMTQLWNDSPLNYVGTRAGQALYVPGWHQHKAQFAGLTKTLCGAFSFLSSYRNVAEGKQYFRNPAHGMGALVTAAGGLQLMLGIDNEQSWQNYGATNMLRLIFIPQSIRKRFIERDRRAVWYAGSVGMFQTENAFAYLVGGAEKEPDGTVVDKQTIRSEAQSSSAADQRWAGPHGMPAISSPDSRIETAQSVHSASEVSPHTSRPSTSLAC